jgi:hypothetical protein
MRKQKQFTYTEHTINEITLCNKDIIYFIEHYIYEKNINGDVSLIKLLPFQKRILKGLVKNQYNIINASRQSGKSMMLLLYSLWISIFKSNKNIIILTLSIRYNKVFTNNFNAHFNNLPEWLRPNIIKHNSSIIELDNNNCIILASSTNNIRGISPDIILLDEPDLIKNIDYSEFYNYTLPIFYGRKDTMMHVFGKFNSDSAFIKYNNVSKFHIYNVNWNYIPLRNAKWKKEMINLLGIEVFNREFKIFRW